MAATDPLPGSAPLARQARWLEAYRLGLRVAEQGTVVAVGDGIIWVRGLPSAAMDDLLALSEGSTALVFHLGRDLLGAILLKESPALSAGTVAHVSGLRLSIAVGDGLLGRVIDPLGAPLDGLAPPQATARGAIDAPSPPIVARDFVNEALYTGSKIVDSMIPIGKGQRQLLIGDNGLGKTAFALDTVINQKGKGVYCVYVIVGQKRSSVVSVIETLRNAGALAHSTVLVAEASTLPGLKYLAPFAGCAVAEAWMRQGRDTLVVYDDLSTHARTYRELSLLLRRPPGREAYPGDIFYLHSRLLERSTHLNAAQGGGSMTALPIIETELGEIATYIPTNLISITDGQIYFEQRLFAAGFLPAIDVTKSVSRIGGNAQDPAVKREAGRLKLDYLQFLELEIFTRFGARLEASMEAKIQRGRLLRDILKQDRLTPWAIEAQFLWMVAFNDGLLDGVATEALPALLAALPARAAAAGLTLDTARERWIQAATAWIQEAKG
ncbi:F0F1 ATP synthase subunit alpha [Acidithiobacillus sulfuriphilus]|uniref:F0F1 ATP synthase subunit alpha n=1 Tax=Acidithiobacillus sulfuriphilus TaxID=1867749 RepID=UPI003F5EB3FE